MELFDGLVDLRHLERQAAGYTDTIVARNGESFANHSLRVSYEDEVRALSTYSDRISPNSTLSEVEEASRAAWLRRRELDVEYKDATPQSLRDFIYDSNNARHNDPLGPSFDFLVERNVGRGMTQREAFEAVIESSARPNDKIDEFLSGYRTWIEQQPIEYLERVAGN